MFISYVKTIVVIKCLAQIEVVWWQRDHFFLEFFGIHYKKNFAIYDLLLLITLFLHRAVLKMFGLWKDEDEFTFHEGIFELDRCDAKTKYLIKHAIHTAGERKVDEDESKTSEEIKTDSNESNDFLICESQSSKVLFRHAFMNGVNEEFYVDAKEIIKAREVIFSDTQGRLAMKIRQDYVKLRLRPINVHDSEKIYPIQRIVEVESVIEEPVDFFPMIFVISIQKHVSLTTKFLRCLFSKHFPRKPVDCYTLMFFFEFVNFFVLVFGFSTFAVSLIILIYKLNNSFNFSLNNHLMTLEQY